MRPNKQTNNIFSFFNQNKMIRPLLLSCVMMLSSAITYGQTAFKTQFNVGIGYADPSYKCGVRDRTAILKSSPVFTTELNFVKPAYTLGIGVSTFSVDYAQSTQLKTDGSWLMYAIFPLFVGPPKYKTYQASGHTQTTFVYGSVSVDWLDKVPNWELYSGLRLGVRQWQGAGSSRVIGETGTVSGETKLTYFGNRKTASAQVTILGLRYQFKQLSLGWELGYGPSFTVGANAGVRF
jgi:hypothetical protein